MKRTLTIVLALLLSASLAHAQTAPPMIANEIGVSLKVCPNGPIVTSGVCPAGPVSLTGASATLRSQLNGKVVANFPCSVSMDGTYCFYTTQAGDFATDGIYQLQLIAVGGGQTLRSQIVRFAVGPALAGTP